MSDERLILITDSTGASLKRWSVSRYASSYGTCCYTPRNRSVRMFGSQCSPHPKASETTALKRENTRLMNALEQRRNERAGLLNADWKLSAIKRRLWRESSLGSSIPLDTSLTKLVGAEDPLSQKQSLDPWSRSTATTSASMSDRLLRP